MSEQNEPNRDQRIPFKSGPTNADGPLFEVERREAEREKRESEYRTHDDAYKDRQAAIAEAQLTTNRKLAVFTGLLVVLGLIGNYVSYLAASAARESANAAESAAKTANLSLHISERAYLVTSSPVVDVNKKVATISLSNSGRLASGAVDVVIHEATYIASTDAGIVGVSEMHWKRNTLPPLLSGHPLNFDIPIPAMDLTKRRAASQVVMIGGYVTYNDGFRDDPAQPLQICSQTRYSTITKQLYWTPCMDSKAAIEKLERLDGYPNGEQKN